MKLTLVNAKALMCITMLACSIQSYGGCNDIAACNYESTDTDDIDCAFINDSCDDLNDATGNDVYITNCICSGQLLGCTDLAALNFNQIAVVDDGSCISPLCTDAPSIWNYCYEDNENGIVVTFGEINSGEGVIIQFNSGIIEAGWDIITLYDGPNSSSPVLYTGDGGLAGLVVASSGESLSIEIISDGIISCGSGALTAIEANVFCATEINPGCTDALACNYNLTANFDDNTCAFINDSCDDLDDSTGNDVYITDCICLGQPLGCTDVAADNYNSEASLEDESCIYNDFCASSQLVTCGATVSGSTINATQGDPNLVANCGPNLEGPNVWYSIIGTGEDMTASTCGDSNFYDSRIHVFSGLCGELICEGVNDDSCGLQSSVTWFGQVGETYYISVSGWNGVIGEFEISFSCAPAVCLPASNDQCMNALVLTDGVMLSGSNVCSYSNDPQPSCDPFASINGVWYVWNSGVNNAATIDFSEAAAPVDSAANAPAVSVFSGTCGALTQLFCDDITLPLEEQEVLELEVGTDYYFLVWTDSNMSEGEFDLTVTGGTSGCTNLGACNYNDAAEIDNGSCDLSCIGCTQICSVNFSSDATFDDGSCLTCACQNNVEEFSYCYGNNENVQLSFTGIDSNHPAGIYFAEGTVETGWDFINVYDGPDNSYPVIAEEISGDLTGLAFQGSQNGGVITVELISDGSVSCGSGALEELTIQTVCSTQAQFWCGLCWNDTPPEYYFDCQNILNGTDWTCCDPNPGCTDNTACNYDDCALDDDGSCCYGVCATITITDTFGDGGGGLTILDDDGALLEVLSLESGFTVTESYCLPTSCLTLVPTSDQFPEEIGIVFETDEGSITIIEPGSEGPSGSFTIAPTQFGECAGQFPGCWDPEANNYSPFAPFECFGALGPDDCCIYQEMIDVCETATAIQPNIIYDWNTEDDYQTGPTDDFPYYQCFFTHIDRSRWFSYLAEENIDVTLRSSSINLAEISVFNGECEGSGLDFEYCQPSLNQEEIFIEMTLFAGETYYFKTGSNANFSSGGIGEFELIIEIAGCTDLNACNYNVTASLDNGSCLFEGDLCAYIEGGLNLIEDCECEFYYFGDYNDDQQITSSDLIELLSHFGSVETLLIGDFDQNGQVGAGDLTSFLAIFGQSVE